MPSEKLWAGQSGWLESRKQPKRFATIAISTLVGIAVNFSSIDPIKALFWSAVINGAVSVPIMVMMMLMTSRIDVMGENTVTGLLRWTGWLSTGVMAIAVVVMFATMFM